MDKPRVIEALLKVKKCLKKRGREEEARKLDVVLKALNKSDWQSKPVVNIPI